jgi:ribosomal-protein-alanine N-acetyltransferase
VNVASPKEAFKLRPFEPKDLDRVIYINRTCLPENYPPDFFLMHHREHPEAFLVAELKGEVVGYSMSRVEHGFSLFRRAFVKKGHVISIAILSFARGMGMASALLERSMEALRKYGATEIYLEVRVSNEPAIRLYRKLGFKPLRRLPAYYVDGEDAWLMARPL